MNLNSYEKNWTFHVVVTLYKYNHTEWKCICFNISDLKRVSDNQKNQWQKRKKNSNYFYLKSVINLQWIINSLRSTKIIGRKISTLLLRFKNNILPVRSFLLLSKYVFSVKLSTWEDLNSNLRHFRCKIFLIDLHYQ